MADIVSPADILTQLGIAASATAAERALVTHTTNIAQPSIRSYLGYSVTQNTYTHFLPARDKHQGKVQGYEVINNRVATYYEDGTDNLYLPERPVRVDGANTITVNEDIGAYGGQGGSDFSGSDLTQGTDYYVDYEDEGISWTGLIVRISGTWSSKARTIKVTYTAGLTSDELDGNASTDVRGPGGRDIREIKNAAILACTLAYKQATQGQDGNEGAIRSERLADYSVTYDDATAKATAYLQRLPDQVKDMLRPWRRLTR